MDMALESLRFLTTARTTICEAFEEAGVDNLQEAKYFITNEATDYEIMSAIMEGELPEYMYDEVHEAKLWKDFNKMILKNRETFVEMIGNEITDNMIFEMGPIFDYGLSSQKPVLEHLVQTGYISEISADELKAKAKETADKAKAKAAELKAKMAKKASELKSSASSAGQRAKADVAKTGQNIKAAGQGVKSAVQGGIEKAKGKTYIQNRTRKQKVMGALQNVKDVAASGAKAAGQGLKQIASTTTGKAGLGAAALAGAAAIAYGAKKIYDKFMSKAAKSCKGAADKSACMKQYKAQAQKAKIAKLQQGMSACKGDEKCKANIAKKIAKEKAKM